MYRFPHQQFDPSLSYYWVNTKGQNWDCPFNKFQTVLQVIRIEMFWSFNGSLMCMEANCWLCDARPSTHTPGCPTTLWWAWWGRATSRSTSTRASSGYRSSSIRNIFPHHRPGIHKGVPCLPPPNPSSRSLLQTEVFTDGAGNSHVCTQNFKFFWNSSKSSRTSLKNAIKERIPVRVRKTLFRDPWVQWLEEL